MADMTEQNVEKDECEEHGYGITSDCLCGRNFPTVRGLREHLTKARVTPADQKEADRG